MDECISAYASAIIALFTDQRFVICNFRRHLLLFYSFCSAEIKSTLHIFQSLQAWFKIEIAFNPLKDVLCALTLHMPTECM
jgi:hypothetical protein